MDDCLHHKLRCRPGNKQTKMKEAVVQKVTQSRPCTAPVLCSLPQKVNYWRFKRQQDYQLKWRLKEKQSGQLGTFQACQVGDVKQ